MRKEKSWEELIITRALKLGLIGNNGRVSLCMDLDSVHISFRGEVKWERLIESSDFDFAHDLAGISAHMDRRQYPGVLAKGFLPRFMREGL